MVHCITISSRTTVWITSFVSAGFWFNLKGQIILISTLFGELKLLFLFPKKIIVSCGTRKYFQRKLHTKIRKTNYYPSSIGSANEETKYLTILTSFQFMGDILCCDSNHDAWGNTSMLLRVKPTYVNKNKKTCLSWLEFMKIGSSGSLVMSRDLELWVSRIKWI